MIHNKNHICNSKFSSFHISTIYFISKPIYPKYYHFHIYSIAITNKVFTLFFVLNLQNPAPVLYLQHLSIEAGHISNAPQSHVASGFHSAQYRSESNPCTLQMRSQRLREVKRPADWWDEEKHWRGGDGVTWKHRFPLLGKLWWLFPLTKPLQCHFFLPRLMMKSLLQLQASYLFPGTDCICPAPPTDQAGSLFKDQLALTIFQTWILWYANCFWR